jgi:type III secretion system FlhB-like substrate exporter
MIAPQQYETDVRVIADVTGDADLSSSIDAVIDAIKHVRSAHQQLAPRVIAKQVRNSAAKIVRDEQADQSMVHLDNDLVLVRVVETASELLPIKYTSANRLIEGDSWHE